jgi:hypothetical protein
MNVYANQRHLALGISVLIYISIVMLPLFKKMKESFNAALVKDKSYGLEQKELKRTEAEKVLEIVKNGTPEEKRVALGEEDLFIQIKNNFRGVKLPETWKEAVFSKDSWIWGSLPRALFVGILLGAMAFFHGSSVIALLGILAVIGLFSKHRLEFAIIAAITFVISQCQAAFFAPGVELAKAQLQFGFIAEDKSFLGIVAYLFELTGFCLIAAVIGLIMDFKRTFLYFTIAAVPFAITFSLSLTPDITVNHKFLMMSLAFFNIFTAYSVVGLWSLKLPSMWSRGAAKLAACALVLILTLTGVMDLFTMTNQDGVGRSAQMDISNDYQTWIKENTDPNDIFMGAWPSLDDVFFAGRRQFMGWPYYAWSGGYDTAGRTEIFKEILNTEDPQRFIQLVAQNKISYIVVDQELLHNTNFTARSDIIEACCKPVYTIEDRNAVVYQTPYGDMQ